MESFAGAQVRSSRFSSVDVSFLCFSLLPTISHQELNRKPPAWPRFRLLKAQAGWSRPSRWHDSMPLLAKDEDWTSLAPADNVLGRIQRDARRLALPTIITALFGRERDVSRHACRYLSDTASSRQGLRQAKIRASDGASRRGLILVTKFTIVGTLLPLSRPFQRQIGHTLKYGSSDSGHVRDWWATLDPRVRYIWRKYPSNGEQGHRRGQ